MSVSKAKPQESPAAGTAKKRIFMLARERRRHGVNAGDEFRDHKVILPRLLEPIPAERRMQVRY